MRELLRYAVLILFISACQPEEIGPQQRTVGHSAPIKGRKIYLVNEGNFGRGGASISVYTPFDKKYYSGVFSAANNGRPVGDVAQHMIRYEDHFYIVVNASGHILVTDTSDMKVQDTISGQMSAPRYMTNSGKNAFVTDLFASKVWLINLETNEVEGNIALPGSGSDLLMWQNKLLVAVNDDMLVIDPFTGTTDTTINLSGSIDRMRLTPDGKLWVLGQGGTSGESQLYRFSSVSTSYRAWRVKRNDLKFLSASGFRSDEFYFAGDQGIYTCRVMGDSLNISELISLDLQNIYAFDADPHTGELYLADALDFDQSSQVYRVDSNGILNDQFKSGIITTFFLFH